VNNDHDLGAPGACAEGSSPLQLEPSKAARKRCQGITRNGTACTAWAMEGGLCYFHENLISDASSRDLAGPLDNLSIDSLCIVSVGW